MASCPHCRASLVEPALFCGVCGARVEVSAHRPDDPSATRQLDGPAAATQPMQAAPSAPALAASSAPPAAAATLPPPSTTTDGPGDSLMRVVRPRWVVPARAGAAVAAVAIVGWLAIRALPGSATVTGDPAAPAAALAEGDPGSDEPTEPTSIRPTPRRVGRAAGRAAQATIGPQGAAATTVTGLEQLQPSAVAGAPAAPIVAPPASAPPPAALPVSPTGAPPQVAAAPPAGPPDAGGSGGLSGDNLENAARYMKGDETVPPSAEELADRDQAEGYAGSIRMVVKAHASQVTACYERAFKLDAPARAARVEVGFHIDKSGAPRNVRAVSNTSGSDALAGCLAQRVGGWRFPRPPGGEFEAVYPFTFSGAR